ncbi:MAG: hypothetical protein ACFE0O_00620 [Opitutales bacterium]
MDDATLIETEKSVLKPLVWRGRGALRKIYKKDNGAGPEDKRRREAGFYAAYRGAPDLPRVFAEEADPPALVIERLPGRPYGQAVPRNDATNFRILSRAYGKAVGTLLAWKPAARIPVDGRLASWSVDTFAGMHQAVMGAAERLCAAHPGFDTAVLGDSRRRATGIGDPAASAFWQEEVPCKFDWNPNNTLVDGLKIAGFVDAEQSYWGIRLTGLGNVIDHLPPLDWVAFIGGLESETGALPTPEAVYAAVCFSIWHKLTDGGRVDEPAPVFEPERLEKRLLHRARLLGLEPVAEKPAGA